MSEVCDVLEVPRPDQASVGAPEDIGSKELAPEQPAIARVVSPGRIVGERIRPPVQQIETAAGQIQRLAEIYLKEVFRDRKRALKV